MKLSVRTLFVSVLGGVAGLFILSFALVGYHTWQFIVARLAFQAATAARDEAQTCAAHGFAWRRDAEALLASLGPDRRARCLQATQRSIVPLGAEKDAVLRWRHELEDALEHHGITPEALDMGTVHNHPLPHGVRVHALTATLRYRSLDDTQLYDLMNFLDYQSDTPSPDTPRTKPYIKLERFSLRRPSPTVPCQHELVFTRVWQ